MHISSDRYLSSHDWLHLEDTETKHHAYVNRITGELCDAVNIPVQPGSIILSPEEQKRRHEYWQHIMEEREKEKRKQCTNLRRKAGPKYFFVSCEESLWSELDPATAARLIRLASYLNYDGKLMLTERRQLRKRDLFGILWLSPALLSSFWAATEGTYLLEDEKGYISMTGRDFFRGPIRQPGQFQIFYIDALRSLYSCTNARQHKTLGYVFRMLPYLHYETNVLCHDPYEPVREKVSFMTISEFCEKIGYHRSNRHRLAKQLSQLYFRNEQGAQRLCYFMMGHGIDTARIFINPHILYRGNSLESLGWLDDFLIPASFCEETDK